MKRISPIYGVKKVMCWEVCQQFTNPNRTSQKQLQAIQESLIRFGFTEPIVVMKNKEFDRSKYKSKTPKELLAMTINNNGDGVNTSSNNMFNCEIKDKEVISHFPYIILDGTQRSSIVKIGSQILLSEEQNKIRKGSVRDRCREIAELENMSIPIIIIDMVCDNGEYREMGIDDHSSLTVLSNSARGTHQIQIIKKMVIEMLEREKDPSSVAKLLNISEDQVSRMINPIQYGESDILADIIRPENSPYFNELVDMYKRRG